MSLVPAVRIGKSGLKVSKIILGFMSYGTPKWQGWVLGEKEAKEHVQACLEYVMSNFRCLAS